MMNDGSIKWYPCKDDVVLYCSRLMVVIGPWFTVILVRAVAHNEVSKAVDFGADLGDLEKQVAKGMGHHLL